MSRSLKTAIVLFLSRHNITIITIVLLAASCYFLVGAQRMRAITHSSNPESFASGDIVTIEEAIDGDELLISNAQGVMTELRLLGIKSFNPTVSDPLLSEYGRICFDYLKARAVKQKAQLRISPKTLDDKGRLLGMLFVEDNEGSYTIDLALELVRKGYTLVYTRYAFADMGAYLALQNQVEQERAGFWSSEKIAARAASLQVLWNEERRDD